MNAISRLRSLIEFMPMGQDKKDIEEVLSLAEKSARIDELNGALKLAKYWIEKSKHEIDERDKIISNLKVEVLKRDALINVLKDENGGKDER